MAVKSRDSVVAVDHNKCGSILCRSASCGNGSAAKKLTASFPKDPIDFWNAIIAMKLKEGEEIVVPINTLIRDPINTLRPPIRRILIRKVINLIKPLLIDCLLVKK